MPRLVISLVCSCLLLIAVFFTVKTELIQAASNDPLIEGAYWTYRIIHKSEAEGSGSYKGTSTFVQTSKGIVTVKELTATKLIIEDHRESNISSHGSGFFKQNSSDHTSMTVTSTIDRQTLIVTSIETKDGTLSSDYMIGRSSVYFVSTSLGEGQNAKYFWGGEVMTCSATKETIDFQDSKIPVIKLQYSGPKKVPIRTVTSFPEDGRAEGTFNFEESTGLLISYTVRETATFKGGACCAITTSNTEDYILESTSLLTTAKTTPTPALTPPPPTSTTTPDEIPPSQATTIREEPTSIVVPRLDNATSLPIVVAIAIIIGLSYHTIRRKRAQK